MANPVLILLDEKEGKKNILSLFDKSGGKILMVNLVRDYEVDEEAEVHSPVFSIRIAPMSPDGHIGQGVEVKLTLEDVYLLVQALQNELHGLVKSFVSLRDFVCSSPQRREEGKEPERLPFFA